jgi:PmbA protein
VDHRCRRRHRHRAPRRSAAFAVSPKIRNSEGASVSAQHSQFVLATSRGFRAAIRTRATSSRARRSPVRAVACSATTGIRRSARRALAEPEAIGRYAAERALARLNARKLSTRKCPVLFEAPLAAGLLGAFVQAVSGGALYRKSTFLYDTLGKAVFAPHIQITRPHVPGAMGSAPFDEEGVRTHARDVVRDGVVQGYFLSTYSARKLGMQTTGNAGGSHNLTLTSSLTQPGDDFAGMLKKMGTGLLVTELMGQGVNYVTGDYSRGASGYWVENGVIQYPVEEITIAGNMVEMLRQIVASVPMRWCAAPRKPARS